MKKILIIAGVLLVVGVVGLVIVAMNLGSIVKSGIETVGPKLTKTELKLDKAGFGLFAGRVELTGLFVGNPEGFKSESAIRVGEIAVQVKPSSLAGAVVEIDEITIKSPVITYEQAFGGNNISKLLANVNESTAALAGGKDDKTAPADPASQKRFRVKLVRVEGATVKIGATMLGGTALPIPLPPITIENIGTSGNGVTAGELTGEVLKQVLSAVTRAVTENLTKGGGLLKDGAGGAVDKAGQGLKNLFKKK